MFNTVCRTGGGALNLFICRERLGGHLTTNVMFSLLELYCSNATT